MSNSAAADQTKLRKRLETLLKLPENQFCCDCGKRGPRWASANLGNFFCIECSGIHRNLGVHISFVRSVNLDTWTPKQVEFMEQWGNARANSYWEANIPRGYAKPKENDAVRVVEKFIRDKYEHKRFVASSVPPPVDRSRPPAETQGNAASAQPAPSRTRQQEAPPAAAPAPVPVQQPNLLDFDAAPAAPQTVFTGFSSVPAQPAAHAQNPHGFGDFSSAPTHTAQHSNGFGDFTSAPAHPAQHFAGGHPNAGVSTHDHHAQHAHNAHHAHAAHHPHHVAHSQDPFAVHPQAAAPVQHAPAAADPFFGSFGDSTTHAPQAAAPAAPPKPQASADAILSLYGAPRGGGGGGMMPPSAYGGHPGHPGMGAPQPQLHHNPSAYPMPAMGGGYHGAPMQAAAPGYGGHPGYAPQQMHMGGQPMQHHAPSPYGGMMPAQPGMMPGGYPPAQYPPAQGGYHGYPPQQQQPPHQQYNMPGAGYR